MNEPVRFQSPEYLAVLSPEASPMHGTIPAACVASMRQAAEQAYPLEACGLLIGTLDNVNWNVREVRAVANLNTERAADRFQLDPEAYRRIDAELRGSGREIIGVYHSHPDCPAKPSPTDLESAWEGFIYPIITVHRGQATDVRCWTLGADERFASVPLLQENT